MTPEAAKALEESIEVWKANAKAETPPLLGIRSCPLCRVFIKEEVESFQDQCRGCPVYEATGKVACNDTPFVEASRANGAWRRNPTIEVLATEFRAAAHKEVAFLESLRETHT